MISFVQEEIAKTSRLVSTIASDSALQDKVVQAATTCSEAIRRGGKVMFCGNGGSAADSQHLAAELVGKLQFNRPAMPGLALTVDSSALTAIGNDFGYEHVFARQLAGLGASGDVLIGISTSGRSKNIVLAMEAARSKGIATIAMTGASRAPMADLADIWIAVPHLETQKIQEAHIMLGHILCGLIELEIHGTTHAAQ